MKHLKRIIDFFSTFLGVFLFLLFTVLTAACMLVDVTLFSHKHWMLWFLAVCATVVFLVATAEAEK